MAAMALPIQAGELSIIEHFNCGTLGRVTLKSASANFSKKAGHTVSAATITIPRRGIRQNGIVHSFMAGNDRTFTHKETDSFRTPEDTSTKNPIMMRLRIGSLFYGKKRKEITVVLLREAYTCVPE